MTKTEKLKLKRFKVAMLIILYVSLAIIGTTLILLIVTPLPLPLMEMVKTVAPFVVTLCITLVPVRLMIGKFKQMDKDLERLKDEVLFLKLKYVTKEESSNEEKH